MFFNHEGIKVVEFFVGTNENINSVLDEVFAYLGFKERPSEEDCLTFDPKPMKELKLQPVSKKVGFMEHTTIQYILHILDKRFHISPYVKEEEELWRISVSPEKAVKMLEKVVLTNSDGRNIIKESLKDIEKLLPIMKEQNITMHVNDDETMVFSKDGNVKNIKMENGTFVEILDPEKPLKPVKPLQKSIIVNSKSSDDVKLAVPVDYVELKPIGKEVEVSTNVPDITLEDTRQIAMRIDNSLLKQFIDFESLKNLTIEDKVYVMVRLESVIKNIMKEEKNWRSLLQTKKKFRMIMESFFDRNTFTMYNREKYWKFTVGNNEFARTL